MRKPCHARPDARSIPMPESSAISGPPGGDAWRRFWLPATLLAALLVTSLDAVLLQQRKSFFTGGFLVDIYTRSLGEAAGFLTISLLADLAVAGLSAAVALIVLRRLRLTPLARWLTIFLAATGPLVIADFLLYEILSYLGDDFDTALMFELIGRRIGEIVAIAGPQLVTPVLLSLAALIGAVVLIWLVQRLGRGTRTPAVVAMRRLIPGAALLLVIGTAVSGARAASETVDDGLQRKPSGRAIAWALELVSDVDRDGYGLGGDFRDPAPLNAAVHPFALDVPGNGVDEDAVAGDLPGDTPAYTESSSLARFDHHPPVVLILLESFRADALGRVVDGRPVTPVLDALAARGISAPMAYSHNGYTAQSRFHTLTGSLAGIRRGSLIDDFKANGYEVGYFSAQDESFGGNEYSVGFDRADVHYDARQDKKRRYTTYATPSSLAVPSRVLLERVDGFLTARDGTRPLFLYLNFHDTHFPYHHDGMTPLISDVALEQAEVVPGNAEQVRAMYYNAAANVDQAIGVALARIESALGVPPAVIVASDHGESLFDSGFLGHGYGLNDEQTRIPLIAAGLPLTITQPFGQVELRDAIAAALCADPATPPRLAVDPDKSIFQYLGKINRPRQIAFTTTAGRTVYDFRTDRVTVPGAPHPEHPTSLTGAVRTRVLDLVRLWERMAIARPASGGSDTD